jgi:hypothetical protein
MRAKLPKFTSSASISVSEVCKREVSAAPRSQVFSEPTSLKAGPCDRLLGVVDILMARYAAVDGLAEQFGQWQLGVLAATRIAPVLGDEIAQAQSSVQLAHQNETAIRGLP